MKPIGQGGPVIISAQGHISYLDVLKICLEDFFLSFLGNEKGNPVGLPVGFGAPRGFERLI
jgi:hypothetical protein